VLSGAFTTFNYDGADGATAATRSVRGGREIEDVDAIVGEAGGLGVPLRFVVGAVLALHANAKLPSIRKVALWEPPYFTEELKDQRPPLDSAATYRSSWRRTVAGRVEFFMAEVVHMPAEFVAQAKQAPWWASQEAIAHTLAYDAGGHGRLSGPGALLLGGDARDRDRRQREPPVPPSSADALAELLPNGERATLEGQEHNIDPAALAPVLERFFNA
jgi:hypothetical protein